MGKVAILVDAVKGRLNFASQPKANPSRRIGELASEALWRICARPPFLPATDSIKTTEQPKKIYRAKPAKLAKENLFSIFPNLAPLALFARDMAFCAREVTKVLTIHNE